MAVRTRLRGKSQKQNGRAPFWLQEKTVPRGPLIEEKAMMIFQPDILIDAQFQASQRRRFHLDPERVLMLAVLQDAIGCFQEHLGAKCKRKQAMYDDAARWALIPATCAMGWRGGNGQRGPEPTQTSERV